MSGKVRVAILISGRGSNMAALLDAAADPSYPAEIVVVISNRPDAAGLSRARAAGVDAVVVDHRACAGDRQAHERAVDEVLRAHGAEIVCLAGYMRLLTPWLVSRWQGRMLNIHPSLLPDLPGLDTHARALAEGRAEHGCTAHVVTDGMDEGPILAQRRVPVLAGDDADSLAARVLEQEHLLYPAALKSFIAELCSGTHALQPRAEPPYNVASFD